MSVHSFKISCHSQELLSHCFSTCIPSNRVSHKWLSTDTEMNTLWIKHYLHKQQQCQHHINKLTITLEQESSEGCAHKPFSPLVEPCTVIQTHSSEHWILTEKQPPSLSRSSSPPEHQLRQAANILLLLAGWGGISPTLSGRPSPTTWLAQTKITT